MFLFHFVKLSMFYVPRSGNKMSWVYLVKWRPTFYLLIPSYYLTGSIGDPYYYCEIKSYFYYWYFACLTKLRYICRGTHQTIIILISFFSYTTISQVSEESMWHSTFVQQKNWTKEECCIYATNTTPNFPKSLWALSWITLYYTMYNVYNNCPSRRKKVVTKKKVLTITFL